MDNLILLLTARLSHHNVLLKTAEEVQLWFSELNYRLCLWNVYHERVMIEFDAQNFKLLIAWMP
jgi:hypothetical protein